MRLGEEARREAGERVDEAERLADEMLADARAVSNGLRQLGKSLGDQAETILRDVQTAHRRIRADLRAVTGSSPSPSSPPSYEEDTMAPRRSARPSVFEDLDVPSWSEPASGRE